MDDEPRIRNLAAARYGELDICKGPIFAATVSDHQSVEQKLLFSVAHRLVVDLIS